MMRENNCISLHWLKIPRNLKKKRQREEEANLRKRHLEVRKELAKKQKEAKMTEERKKAMEARVKEEKAKQIDKLQKLAEEQERLQRLPKTKSRGGFDCSFLIKRKETINSRRRKIDKRVSKERKSERRIKTKEIN